QHAQRNPCFLAVNASARGAAPRRDETALSQLDAAEAASRDAESSRNRSPMNRLENIQNTGRGQTARQKHARTRGKELRDGQILVAGLLRLGHRRRTRRSSLRAP